MEAVPGTIPEKGEVTPAAEGRRPNQMSGTVQTSEPDPKAGLGLAGLGWAGLGWRWIGSSGGTYETI